MDSSIVLMHQVARIRHEERLVRSLAAFAQRTAADTSRRENAVQGARAR